MAGRFLGENIRQTYEIINKCKIQSKNGLTIFVDFEKAFDTIDWDFIRETLTKFNFGPSLIQWVSKSEKGAKTKIQQNGKFSDNIILQRRCRQDDPVSPYLFVLCSEILGEATRRNINIRGINLWGMEHKVS